MRHTHSTTVIGVPLKLMVSMNAPEGIPNNSANLESIYQHISAGDKNRSSHDSQQVSKQKISSNKSSDNSNQLLRDITPPRAARPKPNKKSPVGCIEEEIPLDFDERKLKGQIAEFEQKRRTWEMQKIQKSRSSRRKELSHWVNLLLNNLRKINETLEQDGEKI